MMMGTFYQKADVKGRLVIPQRLREELGGKIIIVGMNEGYLSVYPEADFQELLEEISKISGGANFKRLILANAKTVELDIQGRLTIPHFLFKEFISNIRREVVILGQGNHLEIWDAEKWYSYKEKLSVDPFKRANSDS